jgi:hypothetical protein
VVRADGPDSMYPHVPGRGVWRLRSPVLWRRKRSTSYPMVKLCEYTVPAGAGAARSVCLSAPVSAPAE